MQIVEFVCIGSYFTMRRILKFPGGLRTDCLLSILVIDLVLLLEWLEMTFLNSASRYLSVSSTIEFSINT